MIIRDAMPHDDQHIWMIMLPILRRGETYALPRDWTREEALSYWLSPPHQVYVCESKGNIVGTYFLQPNQKGGGDHIANAGFMVSAEAKGLGVGRAMGIDSLKKCRDQGFCALQFNFVIATNSRALALWQSLGFSIMARIQGGFRHPVIGKVDCFIMIHYLN